jgi:hypothetical protein
MDAVPRHAGQPGDGSECHLLRHHQDQGLEQQGEARELAERAAEPRLAARIRLDLGTIDHRSGELGAWEAVAPVLPELEAHGDLEALAQARTRTTGVYYYVNM